VKAVLYFVSVQAVNSGFSTFDSENTELKAIIRSYSRKGSTRGKSEEQIDEWPEHVLRSKNISKSGGGIGCDALPDPGVGYGQCRGYRAE
jgi:hypothetical protein